MAYKPSDFFMGVIDFFGILVPGAVLLFFHEDLIVNALGLQLSLNQTSLWVMFLLGSYVLGHFLLGIGVPLNGLLRFYRAENKDKFYKEVKEIIDLPPGRKKRTDAFYRAYSFVRLKSASALAEIERQMADYKLFRSLTLVFALDLILVLFRRDAPWPRLLFSGILFILAVLRFLFLLGWTYRITFEYYALLNSSYSYDLKEAAAEQIVGRERRERVSQLDSSGDA